MQIITSITNDPKQITTLPLDNNETAILKLYYRARMQEWYFDLNYGSRNINGLKITLAPNLLRQFRNIIPFGLAVYAEVGGVEPFEIEAFSSGRVKIAILNKSEVEQIEKEVYEISSL